MEKDKNEHKGGIEIVSERRKPESGRSKKSTVENMQIYMTRMGDIGGVCS
jgi:hypothetical protein